MLSNEFIKTFPIWRVNKNSTQKSTDVVAREAVFRMFVNDLDMGTASLSPGDIEDYAVGRIVSEGILRYKEIENVIVSESNIEIAGSRSVAPNERAEPEPVTSDLRILADTVFSSSASLSALGRNWLRTGAFHLAVLFDKEGRLIRAVEDLGRHNAVDKAVGYALRHDIDLSQCFLVSSGRQPGDMISKIARAGLPVIISRAAATDYGITLAEQMGITLIGFAREDRFTIYTHPERIIGACREPAVPDS